MTTSSAICETYERELLECVHGPDDDYRLALIRPNAAGHFGGGTKNYSELGADEASGVGYTVTGIPLKGRKVLEGPSGRVVVFDDVVIGEAYIAAEGGLIYNASKGGKACSVHKLQPAAQMRAGGTLVIRPKLPQRFARA